VENPRPEKVAVVDEVRQRLSDASAVLLTEYRGLDVASSGALRRALRAAGGDYKIYKNTLVRFAARDLGLELDDLLTGPTALAFVDGDAVNVAKALRDFARTHPNLVVKGGLLGTRPLSADQARALADLESREVLLSRLAGALAAPMRQFAGLLQAIPRNFAYGLQALIEDRGGLPADAEPEAASAGEAQPSGASDRRDVENEVSDAPPEEASDAAEAPAEAASETTDLAEGSAGEAQPSGADVIGEAGAGEPGAEDRPDVEDEVSDAEPEGVSEAAQAPAEAATETTDLAEGSAGEAQPSGADVTESE
jgi:large subunit ribosomal protein L10